eukprot:gene18009-biopygen12410
MIRITFLGRIPPQEEAARRALRRLSEGGQSEEVGRPVVIETGGGGRAGVASHRIGPLFPDRTGWAHGAHAYAADPRTRGTRATPSI